MWCRGSGTGPRSARGPVLPTFTVESASRLPGPDWLVARRRAAADAFASSPVPTEKDEVWRYSRIDALDLDRFEAAEPGSAAAEDARTPPSEQVHELVSRLGARSGLVVTIDGVLATVSTRGAERALTLGRITEHAEGDALLGRTLTDPTDFPLLNDAFLLDPVVIDVTEGSVLEDPIVLVHLVTGRGGLAVFPRLVVRIGRGAAASVVEFFVEPGGGLLPEVRSSLLPISDAAREHLVVPVTELDVTDGARLAYVSVQALGTGAWQLAHQASTVGADGRLTSFAVALGGSYARLRTDSALTGSGGVSLLRAAYVGHDDQMLDFRTLQDHLAPRTTSDLLFTGAVAERAHSVYSGMIRVRRGAVKADAMQTNHNLVLDEGAHADSVPNLDIEENDVRCSHGSTVGPVDEDQRYYLESRGVEPERAEQLIVAGFFRSIADQVPIDSMRPLVREQLAGRAGVGDG
jgi:Fe-S cluster assembly protein SufD